MDTQLIQGQFSAKDAIDLISQMVHIKVKYHENKISNSCNEEDTKFSETKIKRLQKDLFDIRKFITQAGGKINIQTEINLSNQS